MPTALIISASTLASDPRVRRHIDALKGHFAVTAAGFGTVALPDVEVVTIAPPPSGSYARKLMQRSGLVTRRFEWYYWRLPYIRQAVKLLSGRRYTSILANDVQTLPLAVRLAERTGARLVFDAHEHAVRQFEDLWLWRTFIRPYHHYILATYLPHVHAMTTVSQGIADAYHREYDVDCQVLTNASQYVELQPSPTRDDRIRLIHHGGATPSRRLETMIEAMSNVDARFSLDLMLVPTSRDYLARLIRLAESHPNVAFREPVALSDIPSTLNTYDVGVYTLPPLNFNQQHALPNKLFEYVQARLAVAIGPSPEMARVVNKHGFGAVASDFTPRGLADTLNALSGDDIREMKHRAHTAAASINADKNAHMLLELMSR